MEPLAIHPTKDATNEWQTALDGIQTAHEENKKLRELLKEILKTIKAHGDTLNSTGITSDL